MLKQFIKSTRGDKINIDFSHINEHQCMYGVQHGYRYIFGPTNAFLIEQENIKHFYPKSGKCDTDPDRVPDTDCRTFLNGATCTKVEHPYVKEDPKYDGPTSEDG
jgi:hypothetical protein